MRTLSCPTRGSSDLIGPGGKPITPFGSAGGQKGRGVRQTERRANEARELRDNARRSTLIAYNGDQGVRRAIGDVTSAGAGNAQGDAGTAPSRTNLDHLKQTSALGTATARMIDARNYLVTAGAIHPCTLQTALDSTVPGYATCILPRDVYSDNGRVVLLEQGTRVFGARSEERRVGNECVRTC